MEERKEEYKIRVFWGTEMTRKSEEMETIEEALQIPDNGSDVMTHTFNTLEELNAFMMGVEQCYGWDRYNIIEI